MFNNRKKKFILVNDSALNNQPTPYTQNKTTVEESIVASTV